LGFFNTKEAGGVEDDIYFEYYGLSGQTFSGCLEVEAKLLAGN